VAEIYAFYSLLSYTVGFSSKTSSKVLQTYSQELENFLEKLSHFSKLPLTLKLF